MDVSVSSVVPTARTPPPRNALAFISITALLDSLGMAIVIPVLPGLVLQFVGQDTGQAAAIFGVFGTVWAAMQFVFSPVMGAISDRYGRRPVILVLNLGLGLDYFLMALAPDLTWLFVGRVISGIAAASMGAAGAYIADVTEADERTVAFGRIGVIFGAGFIIGPALGGLLGAVNPRLPFWIAGLFGVANTIYGFLVLPESLPPEHRGSFAWRSANPFGAFQLLRSRADLLGLALVNFLCQVSMQVLPSVCVLYAAYRYGWGESAVGLMLAAVGVCSSLVGGLMVRRAVHRWGERISLVIGLAVMSGGFLTYGIADTGWLFCIGIPLTAVSGLAFAAIQGLSTRQVGHDEQGQLQGAMGSVTAIAGMVGPGLFTAVFAIAIGRHDLWRVPGAPFLVAAAIAFAGAILTIRVDDAGAVET